MPCKQGFSDWRSRLHYICTTINQWAVCISQKNCNSSEASQPASQLLVPISPTTVEAKKKKQNQRWVEMQTVVDCCKLSHPQYWFDDCEKPAKNSTATKH
jgi:hypothetical protein